MVFCQECGTKNEDSSKFCINCGSNLNGTPITKEESEKQKHEQLLKKAYEKVIENFGGNYEDWYYVNFVTFTRQSKSSARGTTMPLSSTKHDDSGGLLRITTNYLEFIQLSDLTISLFDKQKKRANIDDKFTFIENNYIRIIPFKSITYNERGRIYLNNGQHIGIAEITHLSYASDIKFDKPSYLKNQKEYSVRFTEAYINYINKNNPISKADEINKFKTLLDDGTITEEEFKLFKKDLLG